MTSPEEVILEATVDAAGADEGLTQMIELMERVAAATEAMAATFDTASSSSQDMESSLASAGDSAREAWSVFEEAGVGVAAAAEGAAVGIGSIEGAVGQVNPVLGEMAGLVDTLAESFGGPLEAGIVAAVGAMATLGAGGGALATQMVRTADILGLTTEEADLLSVRFQDVGSNASILTRLGAQLSNVMTQYGQSVENGTAPSLKATVLTKQLHVALTDQTGALRGQGEVLQEAMAALGGMTNKTEAARLASELFGARIAGQIIPVIQNWNNDTANAQNQSGKLAAQMVDAEKTSVQYNTAITSLDMDLEKLQLVALPGLISILQTAGETLDQVGTGIGTVIDVLDSLGVTADRVKGFIEAFGFDMSSLGGFMKNLGLDMVIPGKGLFDIGSNALDAGKSLFGFGGDAKSASDASKDLGTSTDGVTSSTNGLLGPLNAELAALGQLTGAAGSAAGGLATLTQAQINLANSIIKKDQITPLQDATKFLETIGVDLSTLPEGIDVVAMATSYRNALNAPAVKAAGGAGSASAVAYTDAFAATLANGELLRKLTAVWNQTGAETAIAYQKAFTDKTAASADAFANSVNKLIDEFIKAGGRATDSRITNLEAAAAAALVTGSGAQLSDAISALEKGMPKTTGAQASSFAASFFGRQAGGPVEAGVNYLVGEKGPEIFRSNTGGSIIPNGAMGNVTLSMPITIQGNADERTVIAFEQAAMRIIQRQFGVQASQNNTRWART